MNKEIDLEADTIRMALMDTNHSFTATDNTFSNTNEISGAGYTANGAALSSKAVTQAATTKWDAADITWTTGTFTTYHGVIYDDTHSGNDLICSFDPGS